MTKMIRHDKPTRLKVEAVAAMMEPLFLEPEQLVLDYGEIADSVFFVESGQCALVSRRLSSRREYKAKDIFPTYHFGEASLLFKVPCLEKAVSTRYSLLARIRGTSFPQINELCPSFQDRLKTEALHEQSRWLDKLRMILSRLPYLRDADHSLLTTLALASKLLQFNEKDVLFSEGEIASGLWIVMKGFVSLERTVGCLSMPITLLRSGSLLNFDRLACSFRPTEVTARAASFVSCAFLPFSALRGTASLNPRVRDCIMREERAILENELRPYALDYLCLATRTKQRKRRKAVFLSQLGNVTGSARSSLVTGEMGRDSKFKIKNGVLRVMAVLKASRFKVGLFERVVRQLQV